MSAMETKNKMQIRAIACRARVRPGCEPTFVLSDFVLLDAVRLLPNIRCRVRSLSNIRCSLCNLDSTMHRMSDVFAVVTRSFCGNSVYRVPRSPWSSRATGGRTYVIQLA
jgi:hypothetical protein